ncbi:hypothetical protein EUTSA_v10002636mg [Eutrema salsugineum]|uniref:DNA-directed RNA polymerase III subunit RPC4 n=1 Tax=Eutrema salsugineum TaxID=72664 RepID=V4LBB1_EUTSA|nr:uncharacterized protein LOC18014038 [Eutrema salsugineum]XP_024009704.1 uncharacterized protein LOC18014038 [Eutrema salsugineum]XP_024009705.1 uncharacterized protein LOC18014038 [Eutrema salsugineum]XP_024009706.1 uncharacterized protein LOC18014038 [Eutrema salsugineum]ESQ37028.1 hypothetical protein EUTSA_v10002636mg [Eutrema salsugineum]
MEEKPPARKMKFAPKAPPKRVPKPEVKPEVVEDDNNSAQATELLRRVTERSLRKPKGEKKVPASQVAWMGGVVNSTRSDKYLNGSAGAFGSNATQEIEYKEPWDYYSYYPITLPLRRPYAGDPELLDVEEFMQTVGNHEDSLNTAANLGLMEDSGEQKMIFMRLPSVPLVKQSATTENRETKPNSKGGVEKTCDLKAILPEGFMGKLLIYKSGAVKMKLGEVLYDVSPGLKSEFAQDVMVVNTDEKNCCLIGDVYKHAVLTPDIDSILKDIDNM